MEDIIKIQPTFSPYWRNLISDSLGVGDAKIISPLLLDIANYVEISI